MKNPIVRIVAINKAIGMFEVYIHRASGRQPVVETWHAKDAFDIKCMVHHLGYGVTVEVH